jgi:transcriptional regulator with XRE-family HTH domain
MGVLINPATVKEQRALKRWTQDDLVKASKLSIANIKRIEGGKKSHTKRTLNMLAAALDVDPSDLLDKSENNVVKNQRKPFALLGGLIVPAPVTGAILQPIYGLFPGCVIVEDSLRRPENRKKNR